MADGRVEAEWRRQIDQRPERPADAICEAIALSVADALAEGAFDEHLKSRGWVLVHLGDGTRPEAPTQWLHDGLDVALPGWIDPVGRLEELYRQAWTEGNRAGRGGG